MIPKICSAGRGGYLGTDERLPLPVSVTTPLESLLMQKSFRQVCFLTWFCVKSTWLRPPWQDVEVWVTRLHIQQQFPPSQICIEKPSRRFFNRTLSLRWDSWTGVVKVMEIWGEENVDLPKRRLWKWWISESPRPRSWLGSTPGEFPCTWDDVTSVDLSSKQESTPSHTLMEKEQKQQQEISKKLQVLP